MPVRILEAFGIERSRCACLIGAGGKTTLLFALARALAEAGRTVVTTTTTRILVPAPAESECVLAGLAVPDLVLALRVGLALEPHVTVAAARDDREGKLAGYPAAAVDALVSSRVARHVLVEADGAAGRPLKAHREGEPVLPARADLVIAVAGVDAVGAPMDDEHVHRAGLLRERLGRPAGAVVTAEDVAAILLHPEGWLARVRPRTRTIVLLNKASGPGGAAAAGAIAAALRAGDRPRRIARIVIGDAREGSFG